MPSAALILLSSNNRYDDALYVSEYAIPAMQWARGAPAKKQVDEQAEQRSH